MKAKPLCQLDDITDGGSIALKARVDGKKAALMALRQGEQVWLYINSCPHIGAPLDFTPGQFLNVAKTHIQCATHGALFRIDDGFCVRGPCAEKSLSPVACVVRDGAVWLE